MKMNGENIMKTLSIFALSAALFAGTAFSAQAGQVTEYSNTWQPGYVLDDSGVERHSRTSYTDADTGYNSDGATVVKVETSSVSKPGFFADDNNTYVRNVVVKNQKAAVATIEEVRTIWAPGYVADDNGYFYKG